MRSLNIVVAAGLCFLAANSTAETQAKDGRAEVFSYNLRALAFVDTQNPTHSTQNPDNAFLKINRYSGEVQVRPDLFLETPSVSGSLKPRLTSTRRWWEDGAMRGETASQNRTFVNDWQVQVKPHEALFISFGKEKTLWGPSFIASPSNVLFKDTERVNPKTEVEGKYLARLVYLPNNALTITVLSETKKEDNGLSGKSPPVRALKAEIMGSNYLLAAIGYQQRRDRPRVGSYGQWTASDSMVLYYDGIVTKGTDVLYPERDAASPLGASFVRTYDDSAKLFPTITAGGTYTFLSGDTVSMEFLYNRPGYDDAMARAYYELRGDAARHLFDGAGLSGLSQQTLSEALTTGSPFLRQYYLMGQFQSREIKDVLNVILRYTYGLEERAGQASAILEWQATGRLQFFAIGSANVGNRANTEFSSLVGSSLMAGIEAHL